MARNRNNKSKAIPIFKEIIIKNPRTLIPINWEERLDEDRYWYEYDPVFDEFGNCTMKRNLYIVQKELVGFYRVKEKNSNVGQKSIFDLKGDSEDNEDGKSKSSSLY